MIHAGAVGLVLIMGVLSVVVGGVVVVFPVASVQGGGIGKAPRGGALCAKAQSDSVVASVYFTTCRSSGPIRPGPKRMLWS